ncbi:MAG: hypothetical protein JG771_956 [Methermicoccus sp.]|nr:hypothetical protein [Methermicoccus sp.]
MNMYSYIFVQKYTIFLIRHQKNRYLKYFNIIGKFGFNHTMSRARVVIAYGVVENITQSEIISAFKIEIANSRFKLESCSGDDSVIEFFICFVISLLGNRLPFFG